MPAPGVSSEENDGSQAQELTKKVLSPGPGVSSSDVLAVEAIADEAKATADAVAADRARVINGALYEADGETLVPVASVSDLASAIAPKATRGDRIEVRGNTLNDTAAVVTAINQANAAYVATGRQQWLDFVDQTYVVNNLRPKAGIHFDGEGARLIKRVDANPADTANTYQLIFASENNAGGTYYGKYRHMRFSGFDLDPNEKSCFGALVRMLWTEDLVWEGVTVLGYPPLSPEAVSAGLLGNWALNLGGRRGLGRDFTIIGGDGLHEDGWHWQHGSCTVYGYDIASGDDPLAFGGELTASLVAQPDPINGVTIGPGRVRSEKGYATKVYVAPGSAQTVSNVVGRGITGHTGISRNGGVAIQDQNNQPAGTTGISNVDIEAMIDIGGSAHDGQSPYVVWLQGVRDTSVKVRGNVIGPVAFRPYEVENSQDWRADVDMQAVAA